MPQQLTNLSVGEVSLVDSPANPGARVLLFKRNPDADKAVEVYLKREFSDDKRKELASSGAALPDGSFPIETKEDLHNAVRAYGRAKDKPKAKAHIIARAKTLGASDAIPEGWTKRSSVIGKVLASLGFRKEAIDFDDAQAAIETGEYVQDMLGEFEEAMCALRESVCSIMCDDDVTDKRAMIEETFSQYREHVQGVVPEAMEKAMRGAALTAAGLTTEQGNAIKAGDPRMTDAEKAEAERKAKEKEHEDTKKALVIAKRELAVLKMSDKHKSYMEASGMKEDERDAFAEKSPDERDAHMDKHPVKKSAEAQAIEKANAVATDALAQVAKMRDEQALAEVTKRVEAFGGSVELAKQLHAVSKAAPDAVKVIEQTIKGLAEQVRTGKVFAEFGTTNGADATSPEAMMMAKVAEIRKADPKIRSDASAISKIAQMPEHRELWDAYKAATTQKAA